MSAQEVIKNFMTALNRHGYENNDDNASTKMLNAAIKASTKYNTVSEAVNAFLNEQKNSASREVFLEKCGIVLPYTYQVTNGKVKYWVSQTGNTDTGAITGKDAGGTTIKNSDDIVPEYGNRYIAETSSAQNINTGNNDWIVKATESNDTITSGGADSIDAGGGNDNITVTANFSTIKTGSGNDTISIQDTVKDVTFTDLSKGDKININDFTIGNAVFSSGNLTVTDITGSRKIKIHNLKNANEANINSQTIAQWLTEAGYADLASLTTESTSERIGIESVDKKDSLQSSNSENIEGRAPIDTFLNPPESPTNGVIPVESAASAYTGSNTLTVNLNNALNDNSPTGYFIVSGNNGSSFKVSPATSDSTIGSVDSAFPNVTDFYARGLNIHLKGRAKNYNLDNPTELSSINDLTTSEKTILAGLYKWWAKEGLKLIENSYNNMGFQTSEILVNDIDLYFYNDTSKSALAYVRNWPATGNGSANKLQLAVCMDYYDQIDTSNVNGTTSTSGAGELDRTLAHEFTHAVMAANIGYFSKLPQFIKEGMAELTHGIDDERGSTIYELAGNENYSRLSEAVSLTNVSTGKTDCYAAGYMFLRWLDKNGGTSSTGLVAETISGTSGNDNLTSEDGAKVINALGGNDSININLGHNLTIKGGTGDNTIEGNDTLHSFSYVEAGNGNDYINFCGAKSTINAGDGNNTIRSSSYYSNVETPMYIISGTGDDLIRHTLINGTISSGSGNDIIAELWSVLNHNNNNSISAGAGNDIIESRGTSNTIFGGAGNDEIHIFSDSNLIFGDENEDTININSGAKNTIRGGAGNDTISLASGSSNNIIDYFNGDGNDVIYGYNTNSTLRIRKGSLNKSEVSDNNLIFTIGSGKVTLVGAKDKEITIRHSKGNVVSRVYGNETFDGSDDSIPTGQTFTGTSNKDSLVGTEKDDTLQGLKGNDTLTGNAGNDIFLYDNGDGKDVITDYEEGDVIKITSGTISKVSTVSVKKVPKDVVFTIGKGSITLKDAVGKKITVTDKDGNTTSRIYAIENLNINDDDGNLFNVGNDAKVKSINAESRTDAVALIGNSKANTITGSSSSDTLTGGAGNDVFVYGVGNDIITDYKSGQDKIQLKNVTLSSATIDQKSIKLSMTNGNVLTVNGAINSKNNKVSKISIVDDNKQSFSITVGTAANNIQGTSKADILYGTTGNDVLKGAGGNDLFVFSAGKDTISDYSVANKNTDAITLTGGLTFDKYYITGNKKNDVLITFKNQSSDTTSLTLTNGKNKTVTINEVSHTLTDPTEKIFAKNDTLSSSYSASSYSDIITIDASKRATGIYITGNSNDNIIKGTAKADTINAGSGNDKVTGGKGKDLFIYSTGDDTITDYAAGDTIQAAFTNAEIISKKHIKLTTSNGGTITLSNAKGKKITFTSDGTTATTQVLAAKSITVADVDGDTIDASKSYNTNLTTINAGSRKKAIKVVGNSNNNTITGGKGDDNITFGAGANLYVYAKGSGNDTITDYKSTDKIKITGKSVKYTAATSGSDVVITVGTGSITLKNAADKTLNVNGKVVTTTAANFIERTYDELFNDNNFNTNELGNIIDSNEQIGNDFNFTDNGKAFGTSSSTQQQSQLLSSLYQSRKRS